MSDCDLDLVSEIRADVEFIPDLVSEVRADVEFIPEFDLVSEPRVDLRTSTICSSSVGCPCVKGPVACGTNFWSCVETLTFLINPSLIRHSFPVSDLVPNVRRVKCSPGW